MLIPCAYVDVPIALWSNEAADHRSKQNGSGNHRLRAGHLARQFEKKGGQPLKEDVMEQIVDDYLQFRGYFTTHNVRFKPDPRHPDYVASQDRVPSDVDVVALHPQKQGIARVIVVSCKSWQVGFNAGRKLAELRGEARNPKRETWHHFRELWIPKWSEAFCREIERLTGCSSFTYRIAVTRLVGSGDPADWGNDPTIMANLPGCSIGFLTLQEMWSTMLSELQRTPAASEIGRLAQLLKAAGLTAEMALAVPEPPMPGSEARLLEELETDNQVLE